jgi:hypothetical protein
MSSRLDPPAGSSQMVSNNSSSATDMTHDSSETQTSMVSLFFLGPPLLRGICCWGEGAPNVFPSCANPSASNIVQFDLDFSIGKIIVPFTSLRIPSAGENDSQYFWGLDLAVLLPRVPFLAL